MTSTVFNAAFIVVVAAFAHVTCAPEVKATANKIAATFTTPANLSFEELMYIIRVRHGEDAKPPKRFTPCARAILGCCRGKVMNENCSETLKCGAFFFDVNPCDDQFVIDALKAARAFYEQFNSVTR